MARPRLYLVDGSTYIFRAYFAMPSLVNSKGLATGAVYGFTNMLLKLVRDESPDYLAVVFDTSEKSFRNDVYPEYKANRPPAPEDLVPQFPLVRQVTRALNIPALELAGYEADDIIATIATQALGSTVDTVIVSSDKDLLQLVVGDQCRMLDTMKNVLYGPAQVAVKMGVKPDQIVDYLALMGDSVDNIPGVPGIGKKTAAQLLEDYGNLDSIYAHIEDFKGKRRENLETFKDQAYLSQELATVHRQVPMDVSVEGLKCREPDRKALSDLFAELEFKTLHRQFHETDTKEETSTLTKEGFRLVQTEDELEKLAATLSNADTIAVDTETTGLDPHTDELVGLSFATDAHNAWYVPVRHRRLDASPQVTIEAIHRVLGPVLMAQKPQKMLHNAKFDIQVLRNEGLSLNGICFDTMLASYLTAPSRYAHSLDNVALDRLNHKTTTYADVVGKGKNQITFDQLALDVARDYACEDAQVVMALKEPLDKGLVENNLTTLHDDLELPLAHVLADMEYTGIRINTPHLHALSAKLGQRAKELEIQAHGIAGEIFNLASPKQIGHILFEKLGLPPVKKTKTGYSTNSTVLETLAPDHPLPKLLLEWRSLTKLKSTYTDVLPTQVNPVTQRIHTSFNQAVAATGRLSSTNPNLQNIPIRTEDGRRIREAFVPADGHLLVSADYSQVELRVLAHLSQDEAMRRAFVDGADIHARTAQELFGVPEDQVSREQRSVAKTINFGILYGMSAFRLAREQDMSRSEAKGIIDRYFSRYPGIEAWKEKTLEEARSKGRVTTLLGRLRHIPDIHAKNPMTRKGAERVAINTPVQGSAADIIKKAMVVLHTQLATACPEAKMLLQVHDELVFEVPERHATSLAQLVTKTMESVVELRVPLVVNTATGQTWLEAH